MKERYVQLYTLPENFGASSRAVVVAEGILIGDRQTGGVFAQLKLRNVQNSVVKGVTLQIRATDQLWSMRCKQLDRYPAS